MIESDSPTFVGRRYTGSNFTHLLHRPGRRSLDTGDLSWTPAPASIAGTRRASWLTRLREVRLGETPRPGRRGDRYPDKDVSAGVWDPY